VWNGDVLLSEKRGHKEKLYLYEPNSFKPLAFVENNQCYFYHLDHLGTPQEMTDWEGQVVWSARYKVYGNVIRKDVEQVENNLRFQGQYWDEETGLHYNRFRYYDPGTGQFTQQDPIGLLGGVNCYQYAPNPVSWIDPLGMVCKERFDRYKVLREQGFTAQQAAKLSKVSQSKYQTTTMLDKYLGEDDYNNLDRWNLRMSRGTEYFDDERLLDYELDVRENLIVNKKTGLPFDSKDGSNSMFVMHPDGRIFATKGGAVMGNLHHSSLGRGSPVAAAGELTVVEGILLEVNNASGHYRPTQKLNSQFFNELEDRGMDNNVIDKVYRSGFTREADDYNDLRVHPAPNIDFDDYQ